MSHPSPIGLLLRRYRTAAALSQEELAERSGVSARAISDIERGLRSAPRLETVRMLADGLTLGDAERATFFRASRADVDDGNPGSTSEVSSSEKMTPQASRLPFPATPLIGREADVEQIRRLVVEDRARIVTLTGPGGVGKTRLVLAAAETLVPEFDGQVSFLELASLGDPALVASAIASAVGIRDIGDRVLTDVLSGYFRDRRYLLVIDNFEHLLEAGEAVARLLHHSPALTVLATSREPLRIRGEREMSVQPLAIPEVSHEDLQRLAESAAIRLFSDRARDVRPDFQLTNENAGQIVEIIRHLDGLPLAIELAAARIRLLSPQALLQRLEQRLGVLTEGARDAPQRQRTLRDTIAWSYDLLSPDEQLFFRRLSIFVNGFMFDGAEAVAGVPGRDSLDLLTALVEKNLVQAASFEQNAVRFRMLETIREFGLERLAETRTEIELVQQRHFTHFLALAESFSAGSTWGWGSGDAIWYRRLDAEFDNVRLALAWNLERDAAEPYLRLAASLGPYLTTRPIAEEAVEIYRLGLAAGSDIPLDLRLQVMFMAGVFMGSLGRYSEAFEWTDTALEIALSDGDPMLIGIANSLLGVLWESEGKCDRSAESHRAALSAFRQTSPTGWLFQSLSEFGDKLVACGDIDEAVALLDEASSGYTSHSERWGVSMVAQQRGHAAIIQGHLAHARACFQQSIDASREVGDLRLELGAVLGLAAVALAEGCPEDAARIVGAAEHARERNGIGRKLPSPIHNERLILDIRKQLGDEAFDSFVVAGRAMSYEEAFALASESNLPSGSVRD